MAAAPRSIDLFGSPLPPSALDHYKQVENADPHESMAGNLSHAEIRYMEGLERRYAGETPLPTAAETSFRHGGWLPARRRVRDALVAAEIPAKRLERFDCCGAGARLETNEETGEYRVRAFYCGDRFCVPCSVARATRHRRAIALLVGTKPSQFFTLTERAASRTITECINKLLSDFKDLRKMDRWKKTVDGGAFVIEIKRGTGSGEWHVHLHGLFHGRRYEREHLADDWYEASGDSFVVHVEDVRSPERAAGYVCKYITKGFDSSVLRSPDDLRDCVLAARGRRLLVTFGDWYGRGADDQPPRVGRWRVVGGLDGILAKADAGDVWARGVIWGLRCERGQGVVEEVDERGGFAEEFGVRGDRDPPEGS